MQNNEHLKWISLAVTCITQIYTQTALYKLYTILFRTNKIWGKNNQYNEEIAKFIKTAIQQNYTVHNRTHCIQTEVSVPGEKATSATAITLRL
jgi:UDP-N-acetylglucosamine:LPS N-acetylglucosamine transferase